MKPGNIVVLVLPGCEFEQDPPAPSEETCEELAHAVCSTCHQRVPGPRQGYTWCGQCGQQLARRCAACGYCETPISAPRCARCGREF